MKSKWYFPFTPFLMLAFPPPRDMALRVLVVVAVFAMTAAYLAVAQPWRVDGGVKR